jgi:hypothetical protein
MIPSRDLWNLLTFLAFPMAHITVRTCQFLAPYS